MDEHTVCRYTTAAVDCNDVYDPNFNRVDSMCMGLLPGLNTHGMCMVEPDRIVCNTDVNTTHCEVVLTDIFNVTSRVCETISHCHWGPEECDLDALGECERLRLAERAIQGHREVAEDPIEPRPAELGERGVRLMCHGGG